MKKLIFLFTFILVLASACDVNISINADEDLIPEPVVLEDVPVDEPEAPVVPEEVVPEPVVEEEPADEEEDVEAAILNAFKNKYPDWNYDNMTVTVAEVDGDYAAGGINFGPDSGGGYFYAARTATGWVIVADGNGVITCYKIENYDFPASMIPECWDDVNQVSVQR